MTLMLGIDTGGTFTDAVIVDDDDASSIVAWAKAPTSHHDLAIGVADAVRKVLAEVGPERAGTIALVSVSTTLATNALVEGHGESAGLFTFGFSPAELERAGLGAAVAPALVVSLDGGHDAHGNERSPLDVSAIEQRALELADHVSAFAVAAQFSVRNPSHEQAAAELIRSVTGLPVTASHELSAKLDGPRRALTAALNARLLGTIDRLNMAVTTVLAHNNIKAPLMVVRGDGSLVSAAFAGARPIETILSGPAASVIGALHLADLDNGLVVDIGGTTTDVAVIVDGRPSITDGGAAVGSHRTMVEAVDMATVGLGGDSEVRIDTADVQGPVLLGPERAIPMSRLAIDYPSVHIVLDRQLAAPMALTSHGRFLVSTAPAGTELADHREALVLARLAAGPAPAGEVMTSALEQRAAVRLQTRGLIRVATMTPTDASAIVNFVPDVDTEAARKVATILARQTNPTGDVEAANPIALAQSVIDTLIRRSADFVLRVALDADNVDYFGGDGLLAASLAGHRKAASVQISLSSPLTAIGAAAAAYYPAVAAHAGTTSVVPDHADVANAVGAVIGQVRVRRSATITQPTRGQFRVHLHDQPTFGSVDKARSAATDLLQAAVLADAESAGAATPELTETWQERVAHMNGKDVFVEGTLTVEASGRPRF
ncbi:MAG: N-methylhydantoinase A/oxoprolinase/acetone carboxylase beta subunit [Acidimicrobiales bacterium]|jgi:N-methylhydantoinase A/oxoprolinase/acetone carboxylase beta subunit